MAEGGKAAARVVEGIIAKAAARIMPEVAEDAVKAASKDAAKDIAKDTAEDAGKDAAKDAGKDAAKDAGRQSARDTAEGGNDTAKQVADRTATKDPIDVASGEVLLHQMDVELPGVLPLVLDRTHVSSYRTGRWFGTSWASTLDQRLEVDRAGACFVGTEGVVLVYPIPMYGEPTMPVRGPRWPLVAGPDGYTIMNPQQGRTLHFATQPNAGIGGGRAFVLPLKAITDRNGNRIDLVYDGTGTLTEVRHSGGYRIGVETTDGRVTALRLLSADDRPVLKRFGYTGGRLTEVVNASGSPTRFEYDSAGRMTRWEDGNGYWYSYTYDHQGRAVAGRGWGGYLDSTLAYHDGFTVVRDSLGNETTYHLNERGDIVAEVDPFGNVTKSTWDADGRLLSRTDPLDRTLSFTYDGVGNMCAVRQPDGAQVRVEYDDLNLPVRVTEADGREWLAEYADRGLLVASRNPEGTSTRYVHDAHGALREVIDAAGARRRFEVDGTGLPIAAVDPLGAVTRYERDAFGRPVAVIDAVGGVTRMGWTLEGLPAWRVLPDGSTEKWLYDGEGNLATYVDALGNSTTYESFVFDKRVAEISVDGSRLEYEYDSELRLTTVRNTQGLTWRYDYDACGNIVREVDFNGRRIGYGYDACAQLVRRVNGAGELTSYSYDELGNLLEERTEDGVAHFRYDAAGRMIQASNQECDLLLHRNHLGNVVAEVCEQRVLSSVYDQMGRRVHRRTPGLSESRWTYDLAGNATALRIAGREIRFGRDPAGRESRRWVGDAVVIDHQWDAAHRLIAQTVWGAPVPGVDDQARLIEHRVRLYTKNGLFDRVSDRSLGTRAYRHDTVGRVLGVSGQGLYERYQYDLSGNILNATWQNPADRATVADLVGDREYGGVLIRRAGNVRYEYDRQGRVVLRQHKRPSSKPLTWHYHWDARDRLVAVTTPDGSEWRYRYDALGRRISKEGIEGRDRTTAEFVRYTWDGPILVEQARSRPGCPTETTAWDFEPDTFQPIGQIRSEIADDGSNARINEGFFAIVADTTGAPTELIDEAGDVAWRRHSTVWGEPISEYGRSVRCELRFPGQYFDDETSLTYNYYRYYDSSVGRYLTPDPLGLTPQPDPYAYVYNPTRLIDPFGLAPYDFQNTKLAFEHYAKHVKGVILRNGRVSLKRGGADMAEFGSFKEYRQAAQNFMAHDPPEGVIDMVRPRDGATVRFDPASGHYGARSAAGIIRTFFRPDDGFDYFKRDLLNF